MIFLFVVVASSEYSSISPERVRLYLYPQRTGGKQKFTFDNLAFILEQWFQTWRLLPDFQGATELNFEDRGICPF